MEPTFVQIDRESRAGVSTTPTSSLELSQKVAALTALTAQQLRTEWRRLYRSHPPRLSRDLLVRTLAYRLQELAYGGLSKATQRKLAALTKELQTNGSIASDAGPRVRPGARLVREWRGRTHTVFVMEEGSDMLVGRRITPAPVRRGRNAAFVPSLKRYAPQIRISRQRRRRPKPGAERLNISYFALRVDAGVAKTGARLEDDLINWCRQISMTRSTPETCQRTNILRARRQRLGPLALQKLGMILVSRNSSNRRMNIFSVSMNSPNPYSRAFIVLDTMS